MKETFSPELKKCRFLFPSVYNSFALAYKYQGFGIGVFAQKRSPTLKCHYQINKKGSREFALLNQAEYQSS